MKKQENSQNEEFFGEEPQEREENAFEQKNRENQKTDGVKRPSDFWKRASAVALAAGLFGAGYLASHLQYDSELRALRRIKNAIQKHYYEQVTDEEFYGVLFDAVNENLLDAYSQYMTPDEYQGVLTEATGEWSGLGVTFLTENAQGEKQMLIYRVSGNSPAEEVGVLEGDYLIGYGMDGNTITLTDDYDEFYAFVQAREKDETFYIKLRRGESELILSIAKKTFVENYVFYRSSTTAYAFTGDGASVLTERGEPLTSLASDTAYIRLTQFNGQAAAEFKQAMQTFKQEEKTHLVLDLRGNGGGYMDILQEIAAYFCKGSEGKSLIAVAKYREGQKESFYAKDSYYSQYFGENSKIKVLADSSSASASECLLGCMLDYGAISYGDICLSERSGVAKTYGKGIMQSTYPFGLVGSVDAIKLTTAQIYWPKSETCIHGRGILPEDGTKTVAENYEKDVEINAAIAKLFA